MTETPKLTAEREQKIRQEFCRHGCVVDLMLAALDSERDARQAEQEAHAIALAKLGYFRDALMEILRLPDGGLPDEMDAAIVDTAAEHAAERDHLTARVQALEGDIAAARELLTMPMPFYATDTGDWVNVDDWTARRDVVDHDLRECLIPASSQETR